MKKIKSFIFGLSALCIACAGSLGAETLTDATKAEQLKKFDAQFYGALKTTPAVEDSYTKVFKDPLHKFQVELPDNWSLGEGFSDKRLDFVLIALSPEDQQADPFIENMNILVEDLGKEVALREYFMWNLVGLMQELPNFHMHEKSNATVNGVQMQVLVYSWDLQSETTATYQFIFVKGTKGYVITFSAQPDKFEDYRPVFDRIAASFDFED